MKHIGAFIMGCILTSVCHGQEMTLQECIKTGIANNLSVANARIDMDKGRTGVSQNRSRLLPVINGIVQFTDYLKSPVNVTTGTLLGSDFPEDPTWQTIKSMPYNANAGIQLSMPLYNQTLLAAIDVARTVEKISSLSYEKAVEDLTVQISKVYYMAQASQEQERLTDENILRMEELCDITEALHQQGVVMEVDLNRVRINLQNLKALHDQSRTLHCQQLNMLRFLMDMPPETPLEVTRMAESIEPLPTTGVNRALPELLLSEQQKTLAEQRIRTVKAGYLPSLSLTGYAGALGYQEKFRHFFHTDAATDNWFGNCYVSLSVRIPLFEANSKRLQIKQYKYDVRQAANRMELTRKQLDENYENAMLQLNHNMEVFRTQMESRRQAENVFNVTEEQYKEGVASMTALLQDEMQLRTAQTACVQALCQCCLARLDLLKLSGNLSQLSR
ncbi:MAG: TolC family protein [Bacteroidales bacterium]|nr:TolC family protein [Bacteroidales bacterium]